MCAVLAVVAGRACGPNAALYAGVTVLIQRTLCRLVTHRVFGGLAAYWLPGRLVIYRAFSRLVIYRAFSPQGPVGDDFQLVLAVCGRELAPDLSPGFQP